MATSKRDASLHGYGLKNMKSLRGEIFWEGGASDKGEGILSDSNAAGKEG